LVRGTHGPALYAIVPTRTVTAVTTAREICGGRRHRLLPGLYISFVTSK
jgi:hypothetical protein